MSLTLNWTDQAELPLDTFRAEVVAGVAQGQRLCALFAHPLEGRLASWAVLADDRQSELRVLRSRLEDSYRALTPDCPSAHWFERELHEQWGVVPEGHPWLKPIRFHAPYTGGSAPLIGDAPFFRVQGDEVHEVAVGPVHAGVIEPGHFRFQCHGERVFTLEISLGYQHRGIERRLVGGPGKRTLAYMETLAGDTSIGHAWAYCQALESLAGVTVAPSAQVVRGLALELERLANHVGDMGALSVDVGFLPTASYCGRLRGDFLNLTAGLCGSRFGRGLLRPGGVRFGFDPAQAEVMRGRLKILEGEVRQALRLAMHNGSVQERYEGSGVVSLKDCRALGLVGPAARACGWDLDVRRDFPYGPYREHPIPVTPADQGDVYARARVRWNEIDHSLAYCDRLLQLPGEAAPLTKVELPPRQLAVSLVEGWRGQICHVALTDGEGRFLHYKVVDPSFHNWAGLAMALRDQPIFDFPLNNKSFNLSYCGHDL